MRWPVDKFTISQGYHAGHTANDLAAPQGVPILAPTTGTINGVNKNAAGYFGGMYIILNGDNGYRYYMGHCSAVDVNAGQRVTEGQKIGSVGMTGQATGPHVHFEISKGGQTFDPSKLTTNTKEVNVKPRDTTVDEDLGKVLLQLWGRRGDAINDRSALASIVGQPIWKAKDILVGSKEGEQRLDNLADYPRLAESLRQAQAAPAKPDSDAEKKLQAIKDVLGVK